MDVKHRGRKPPRRYKDMRHETEKRYQVILTLNGESVVLEQGNGEYAESMMNWYNAHKEFFNGEFSIREER